MDRDDPWDDIAAGILSEDPLTRVRALHSSVFAAPALATKLRVVGGISAAAAATVLVLAGARTAALRETFGTQPLAAAVSASLVLAAGLKFLTLGALLLGIAVHLHGREVTTESRARRLVGIETTGFFLGVGPGLLGTLLGLLALAWLAAGTAAAGGGVLRLQRLARPVPLPLTYGALAAWAGAVAAATLGSSLAVDAEG